MEQKLRLFLVAFAVQIFCRTVTTQGSKDARRDHVYLASQIPQDGVLVSVWGTFKSSERLWLQIWRPVDNSPRRMKLLHEKEVRGPSLQGEKTNLTFSFGNSDAMCPIVMMNDCIGLYSSSDPFPIDWDRNNFRDIYEYRVSNNRPRVGDMKDFLGTFIHPFFFGGQTRKLADGEAQMSPDSITFVECGRLDTTLAPTSANPTDSTSAETFTDTMTSLAESTSENNGTTVAVSPGGLSAMANTGMLAGIGVAAGVVLIVVVIIAVCCSRKRRAPSGEKDKAPPIITTVSEISSTSNLTATRNQAYGMNTDFLHPNTYEAMDPSSKRVSTHDYSPVLPPRPSPKPSPKPEHNATENGPKVAQLKETLGVALPGLSPVNGSAPPKVKPAVMAKPGINPSDPRRGSPYLDLMMDNGNGYSYVTNDTAPDGNIERQDSAGYERIQL